MKQYTIQISDQLEEKLQILMDLIPNTSEEKLITELVDNAIDIWIESKIKSKIFGVK